MSSPNCRPPPPVGTRAGDLPLGPLSSETAAAATPHLVLDDASLSLAYEQIRLIARRYRASGLHADSVGTTDVAHDSLARMLERLAGVPFHSEQHLINTASQVMYRLLVDRLRRRKLRAAALKEIGEAAADLGLISRQDDAAAAFVDELSLLDQRRPRAAEVLRYRCFFRMTLDEIATETGWSMSTVRREIAFARAFLLKPGHLFAAETPGA